MCLFFSSFFFFSFFGGTELSCLIVLSNYVGISSCLDFVRRTPLLAKETIPLVYSAALLPKLIQKHGYFQLAYSARELHPPVLSQGNSSLSSPSLP
ncbi:hypothetical protein BDV33DRAFT_7977 [Aspergillus novoparasiticus]|uniref:Uncharacterized protein n=1 Tax=Aspergillus novoparasiticus TaxID=986946 RepID=A0A5N6EEB7_9EURO|nr:hypothetical protein BDV33DRAFT_7977 [Aspergillus novoparasiticus]